MFAHAAIAPYLHIAGTCYKCSLNRARYLAPVYEHAQAESWTAPRETKLTVISLLAPLDAAHTCYAALLSSLYKTAVSDSQCTRHSACPLLPAPQLTTDRAAGLVLLGF